MTAIGNSSKVCKTARTVRNAKTIRTVRIGRISRIGRIGRIGIDWRQVLGHLSERTQSHPSRHPCFLPSLEVKKLLEKDYDLQKVLVSVEKARYTLK